MAFVTRIVPPGRPHLRVIPDAQNLPDYNGANEGEFAAPSLAGLYDQYASYVAAVAIRLLGRDDDLEDVVHDVFSRAAVALPGLRDPRAAKGWLASIAVRVAVGRIRWSRLRNAIGAGADRTYEDLPDPSLPPDRRALMAQIYRALERVPAAARVAWTLHHLEGMSFEEVAATIGCSVSTAKRRAVRASRSLKRMLKDG